MVRRVVVHWALGDGRRPVQARSLVLVRRPGPIGEVPMRRAGRVRRHHVVRGDGSPRTVLHAEAARVERVLVAAVRRRVARILRLLLLAPIQQHELLRLIFLSGTRVQVVLFVVGRLLHLATGLDRRTEFG